MYIFSEKQLQEIEEIIENDFQFIEVRKMIQKAIDVNPKSVTYEQALKQIKSFGAFA